MVPFKKFSSGLISLTLSASILSATALNSWATDDEDLALYQKELGELGEKTFGIPLSPEGIISKIFNFDVVVDNGQYTIYRTSLLGKYGLKALAKILQEKRLPFPKTIIYMNKQGYNGLVPPVIGNFAVEEYLGQKEYGYRFHHPFDYSNRTYLDGHNPLGPKEDIDDDWYLFGKTARDLFNMIEDNQVDGGVNNFMRILGIILDKRNSPVLFHCFGGRHRTGMIGLAIRYLQGGEWVEGKRKDVYLPLQNRTVSLNPAQQEYYQHNKEMVRVENFEFIEQISQNPRFLELKERYGTQLNQHGSKQLRNGQKKTDLDSLFE